MPSPSSRLVERARLILLMLFLIWPLVQIGLSKSTGMSPWRLFGWGMYAAPQAHDTKRLHLVDVSAPCLELRPNILHEALVVYLTDTVPIEGKPSWHLLDRALSLEWDRYGEALTKIILAEDTSVVVMVEERRFAGNGDVVPFAVRPYGIASGLGPAHELPAECLDKLMAGSMAAEARREQRKNMNRRDGH